MPTSELVEAKARPADEARTKNAARRVRRSGRVPAVVYGAKKESIPITVDPKQITRILHSDSGHNTVFDLSVGDERTKAMIVDWQYDPIKDNLLHVDLKRIDLTRRITVKVPVVTHGDPKGVKLQGGLLELVVREIEIECLPDDIPEQFTFDVSDLMLGQSIRVSDVPLTGSMKLLSASDGMIAHVVALKADTTAEAAETAAAPEPEVTKKGKKEEAPAEPAKKK